MPINKKDQITAESVYLSAWVGAIRRESMKETKMLHSPRQKNEATYRGGEETGRPAVCVTPDLSYYSSTTGTEQESNARIINGMI